MPDSLCIVIVTYNAAKWLDTCLGPLVDMPEHWKLIIVDNASGDDTIRLAREKVPRARIIENRSNLGFGRANNLGLQAALAENAAHVLLLNQDVCISVADITRLAELQKDNPEYCVISPAHLDATGANVDYSFADSMLPKNCKGIMADSLQGCVKQLYPVKFVCAAIWLVSRRCLQTVGGFNPAFFHYGEDNNYLQRLAYHGLKCAIAPGVFARHYRKQGAKSKPLGKSYTDKIIQFSNPFESEPGKWQVASHAVLQAVSLLFCGHTRHAAFIWREHCGLFRENLLLEAKKCTLEKGPSFIECDDEPRSLTQSPHD
ncbi:MAG: glycosyltransferase family 2 protein [Desulfovibrio sp.]|jgi:GT2 family glycosyltransferase|nr:glycosyltransferase family 2 protein [Desulfovibrio sp.]